MNDELKITGNPDDLNIIRNLEERLAELEKKLSVQNIPGETEQVLSLNIPQQDNDELEFRIGQFWLPKLGIFIFIIGVVFSLTLPFDHLHAIVPSVAGYGLALAILGLAIFTRNYFPWLTGYLFGGSAAIAYLSTLRLYFFGTEQVLSSLFIELTGLLFVVYSTLWYSIKNKSVYLASLSIFLGYFTALTVNIEILSFCLILTTSAVSVYLFIKNEWQGLLIFSIVISYLTHLMWFINNPFSGSSFEAVKHSDLNLFFILAYVLISAYGILKRKSSLSEEYPDFFSSLLNSAFGYGLFLIITLFNPSEYFSLYHLLAAIVFLTVAVIFWIKERSQYTTFIYAMTGYAALSVAIIYQFSSPANLILLCWQSLLVLSTAVWFKSRFIIIANFIIFLVVLAAYLFNGSTTGTESLSFGLVALVSARILNWQKKRLELKTEQFRNSYLFIALFWIPYVFYSVLPSVYVGLSLLALALAYFGMGKLIRNLKYRWMAVMTLLIAVFYLMFFGITISDINYKIASFLSAGIILIITSAVYSKIKSKSVK